MARHAKRGGPFFVPDCSLAPRYRVQTRGWRARPALAGAATLASRLLGLVRDQMLAALFGAGNEMDAFIVAFRIPNLVRDLFAEGAMSAAFVPDLHAASHAARKGRCVAPRQQRAERAAASSPACWSCSASCSPRRSSALYARDFATVPGKLELTVQLTRIVLPFLTLVAVAAAMMGMLNSLHHYFRAGAGAGDVQRRHDRRARWRWCR